ncbi:MAG: TetR/AcrR family transcriptional regulator C-terminal ligand-binding domain-containing protein [Bacteroidetes bacterium]|nr:TetR/AcrR family transcriptional regulator C-terminal ligand-binding domain-containing protein [Bacteroidota bacterium]
MMHRAELLTFYEEDVHRHGASGLVLDPSDAYFTSADDVVLAILDERIGPRFIAYWHSILSEQGTFQDVFRRFFVRMIDSVREDEIRFGCPLFGLLHELSATNTIYRERLQLIIDAMIDVCRTLIRRGIEHGELPADIDVDAVATWIIASVEGAWGIAKVHATKDALRTALLGVQTALEAMRPPRIGATTRG